jgi:hypothetical protein
VAIVNEEYKQMARKVLSAINWMSRAGLGDATVSGNSTVTLLIAAIEGASGFTSGGSTPDLLSKIARNFSFAVTCGALSESHGQTTIAGLRNAVSAQIPEVGADLDTYL